MRVLFVSTPGIGHVFPLVPLAWALRVAGHEVLVATTGSALAVADAGLPVANLADGFDFRAVREQARRDHPELIERLRNTQMTDLSQALFIFSRISKMMADGVVKIADDFRPDLVVHSPMNGAALLVAGRLGVPAVEHGFGFARTAHLHDAMYDSLVEEFAAHGAAGLPEQRISLDVAPPSMLTEPSTGWPTQYVPYNGGGVLADWLRERPARPRIAVTLGTVAVETNGLGPVERIVTLAPKIDAEFVLALGNADLSGLGELPPNVRAVGWAPLGALLETCSGVVHHGGAGTTLTALAAEVPQVVLPSGADRFINAGAVRDRGAGLVATAEDLDVPLLETLLRDDGLRAAGAEVRAEIAAMPSPSSVVPRLAAALG
ncbi:DUF1205 domain-containing protein [Solihabitans fulvus]|uniref:DUF1205 domain-containing protein n=1 Tax=Solihabitans fulvus TaxID=1892852 RepID=A0A5B2XEF1_9PSEU|nr:nucleotide disphospho-sugar-binding domain-containing protein [Solihabitans fulvus]KAA2261320.1 DUF1205 domain-containing protein [Solihabitans fulvus]